MGTLNADRGKTLFTGACTVRVDSAAHHATRSSARRLLIGGRVKKIVDSHGSVRVGSPVHPGEHGAVSAAQNQLIIDDDAAIGPGAMIHGRHNIRRGSVVELGAIVCDGSAVGAESVVRAGACVKQRDRSATGPPGRLPGEASPSGAGPKREVSVPTTSARTRWCIGGDDLDPGRCTRCALGLGCSRRRPAGQGASQRPRPLRGAESSILAMTWTGIKEEGRHSTTNGSDQPRSPRTRAITWRLYSLYVSVMKLARCVRPGTPASPGRTLSRPGLGGSWRSSGGRLRVSRGRRRPRPGRRRSRSGWSTAGTPALDRRPSDRGTGELKAEISSALAR